MPNDALRKDIFSTIRNIRKWEASSSAELADGNRNHGWDDGDAVPGLHVHVVEG
jgi:hypothetical protein